jgi:hypothetical protein
LAIVGIVCLGAAGCSSPSTTASGPTVKVGESVRVDNLNYTVTSVDKTSDKGRIIVDLSIENTGDKDTDFDGEMATMYDAEGKMYELDLEAASDCCKQAGDTYKNLWFSKLTPGEKAMTKAVFSVPASAEGLKIEFRSADIGSDAAAFVTLGA